MTRLIIALAVAMTLTSSAAAHAGKIFGDIRLGDKPVPEGVKVTVTTLITVPAATGETGEASPKATVADSTVTDKFGAYTLKVKGEGKCTLTVHWDTQAPSIEIISYNSTTRYDLILEKKDDTYIVKRK
jgi:hypothetical protein